MMDFFSIKNIFFNILGYPMSYLEFFGTLSGAIAVLLSARGNLFSWPLGIINVALTFFLFFQVQLYPDMFLQVFFLITNLIGWWRWANPKAGEEDLKNQLKISWANTRERFLMLATGISGTLVFGLLAAQLHHWFPTFFVQPSALPFADSFITVVSILATFLMINKKIECWILWIVVDMLATAVYFSRDLRLYSLLYLVYCFMALYGLIYWIRIHKSYQP